jgi:hypothetical protein
VPRPMTFWGNSGPEMHIKFMCVQRVNSQIGRAKGEFTKSQLTDRRPKGTSHRSVDQRGKSQIGRPNKQVTDRWIKEASHISIAKRQVTDRRPEASIHRSITKRQVTDRPQRGKLQIGHKEASHRSATKRQVTDRPPEESIHRSAAQSGKSQIVQGKQQVCPSVRERQRLPLFNSLIVTFTAGSPLPAGWIRSDA